MFAGLAEFRFNLRMNITTRHDCFLGRTNAFFLVRKIVTADFNQLTMADYAILAMRMIILIVWSVARLAVILNQCENVSELAALELTSGIPEYRLITLSVSLCFPIGSVLTEASGNLFAVARTG